MIVSLSTGTILTPTLLSASNNYSIPTERSDSISVQVVYAPAGGASGNVAKLQASNNGSDWADLESVAIESASGSEIWSVPTVNFAHLRVSYVKDTGNVTLSIYVCRVYK